MQNHQSPIIIIDTPENTNAPKRKILLIASVIGGLIIIFSLAAIVVVLLNSRNTPQTGDRDAIVEALLKDEETTPSIVIAELSYVLEEEGADEYIKQFQKVIDSASSVETKAEYYLARADGLYNFDLSEDNDFSHREQILADAKEAEKIAPSIDSAQALYIYADAFGDSELADYYENLFDKRSIESINETD